MKKRKQTKMGKEWKKWFGCLSGTFSDERNRPLARFFRRFLRIRFARVLQEETGFLMSHKRKIPPNVFLHQATHIFSW